MVRHQAPRSEWRGAVDRRAGSTTRCVLSHDVDNPQEEQTRRDRPQHLCQLELDDQGAPSCWQEAIFDRIAETVLDEADRLATEMRAAAIAEETARLGQHPDYLTTVAIGRTGLQAIRQVVDEQVHSLMT